MADKKEEKTEMSNSTVWKIVVYILSIVGVIVALLYEETKKDKSIVYHAKQSLGIFAVWFVLYILVLIIGGPFFMFGILYSIPSLVWLILTILGILNAMNNKDVPVPLVGTYFENIKI